MNEPNLLGTSKSTALTLTGPIEAQSTFAGETAAPSGGGYRLWKALHRRGVTAFLIAIPIAAAAGAGVWFLKPDQYTSTALLQIAANDRTLAFETADERGKEIFSDYKRTQRQLIRSTKVLNAALRNDEVAALPALQNTADPLLWLEKNLDVTFPDDAQVMTVSISASPPQGLDKLVNEVVSSYLEAFVQKEHQQKMIRLNSLKLTHTRFEEKLRGRRAELKKTLEALGENAPDRASFEQQAAMQQYSNLQQELLHLQLDILQGELEIQQPLENEEDKAARREEEFRLVAQADPELQRLREEKERYERYMRDFEAALKPEVAKRSAAEHQEKLQTHDAGIAAREEELRKEFVEFQNRRGATQSASQKRDIAMLRAREKQLKSRLDDARSNLLVPNALPNTDVEMMRVDIEVLETVLKDILGEIERTMVELQPQPNAEFNGRVTVLSRADTPRKADPLEKLKTTCAATCAGFILPILLLLWLESRNDRILTRDEIIRGAGLSVLGAVPLVPKKVMRRLSDSRARNSTFWRSRLTESVDHVAAMLQRSGRLSSLRVVMVSSSMAGEGKTTLATNLAASLAASGTRVALVDFDLRRPALHRVFDLPLEPGVCESLQDLSLLDAALQPTQVPNLHFLAAGKGNQRGLSKLSGDHLKNFFAALRERFDFVVVDTSPILPVVDACLVAQYVDTVVFSVLSDVSRMAQVRMAAHQMEEFGVSVAGVVMIGSSRGAYPLSYGDRYTYSAAS
jgi:capsular exopolysaccharide synthesis family protein